MHYERTDGRTDDALSYKVEYSHGSLVHNQYNERMLATMKEILMDLCRPLSVVSVSLLCLNVTYGVEYNNLFINHYNPLYCMTHVTIPF